MKRQSIEELIIEAVLEDVTVEGNFPEWSETFPVIEEKDKKRLIVHIRDLINSLPSR